MLFILELHLVNTSCCLIKNKLKKKKKLRWKKRNVSSNMPAESCSSWLGPLTRGRDVLVLNLPTGHTERISTHFYEHTKHHLYKCRSRYEYVSMCLHIWVWDLYAVTCRVSFFVCLQDVRSVKWSVLIPSPQSPSCSPARPLKPNRGITV